MAEKKTRRSMADVLAEQRKLLGEGAAPAVTFQPPAAESVVIPPRSELGDLAACEAAINNLRTAYWAAGKALQAIRDKRLYPEEYGSFEEYCQDRWEMTRRTADRLIAAWPLAERLRPIGLTAVNEGQVRELLPLAQRHGEDAAETVYRTIAETDGVKVTATVIKGAVAVLPDADEFDAEQAVAQIRAYLAGELAPPAAAPADPAQQVERFLTTIRRLKVDRLRAAAGPERRRELAAELRHLADEMEQDAG